MGRVKDVWKCMGFKLAVTITDGEGRVLMDERAVTQSMSAYVDQGEKAGQVEEMVESQLKGALAKDERDARAHLRGIHGQHVEPTRTEINIAVSAPIAQVRDDNVVPPPPPKEGGDVCATCRDKSMGHPCPTCEPVMYKEMTEAKARGQDPGPSQDSVDALAGGGDPAKEQALENLPNSPVWFGPYKDQRVSDMDLGELRRNQERGKIYASGKKDGAMRNDQRAYDFANAVDAWEKFWSNVERENQKLAQIDDDPPGSG